MWRAPISGSHYYQLKIANRMCAWEVALRPCGKGARRSLEGRRPRDLTVGRGKNQETEARTKSHVNSISERRHRSRDPSTLNPHHSSGRPNLTNTNQAFYALCTWRNLSAVAGCRWQQQEVGPVSGSAPRHFRAALGKRDRGSLWFPEPRAETAESPAF